MKNIIIALLLLFVATSISFGNEPPKKKKKTNLVFIITDQQQYKALGLAGNKVLKTPNLDRLGKDGAYFVNAYSACAVCGPARSSILTGRTVENTGVNNNDKTYYYTKEKVMQHPTFDELLKEEGYTCEYYGKWHAMANKAKVYSNPEKYARNGKYAFDHGGQSFFYQDWLNESLKKRALENGEHIDRFTKRPYTPDPIDTFFGQEYKDVKNIKKSQPNFHGRLNIPKEYTMTAFQAQQTIDAIERLKKKPFSITCSFHYPHAPMIVPEPFYSMYKPEDMTPPESINDEMKNSPYANANGRKKLKEYSDPEKIKYMISNYYGLITEVDYWIGQIIDKIDELGLTENTLIVFTSDHGEMLGAHGLREKNVFYEESAHIPLLMKLPTQIKPNSTVDGYVSHIDIFSTILDYMDVDAPSADGKSLRNMIEGKEEEYGDYVVTEWNYRGDVSPNYMIVKDGWKLMIPYSVESKVINVLYNMNEDPHEMNNLLGKNPNQEQYTEKAEELRSALLEWLKKNNSKFYDGVKNRVLVKNI
ncbi:sulfatase-like hydrolase/transferase [Flammeovirga sp. OC4]|uniref:sulfatase-like hydrolase/transferase n=1 Tax=Flammeovirga sp. OC4 TaxID=1382345 RepID=UPI0005C48690|nr:sulfatase-like hydrolase/transferase [Flammeovirga sp. OC4]